MDRYPDSFVESEDGIEMEAMDGQSSSSNYSDSTENKGVALDFKNSPSYLSSSHYDDYDTIDWIRDTIVARRQDEHVEIQAKRGLKGKVELLFYQCQGWILLLIVAVALGLIASCLNLSVEFLFDTRFGYCSRGIFQSRKLCCQLDESTVLFDSCSDWHDWADIIHLTQNAFIIFFVNWFFYIVISAFFAFLASLFVKNLSRWAGGSGIPEVKVILGGFVIKLFNTWQTLLTKSIGLVLAVSSGLSVGKEGPMIHIATATCEVIGNLFPKYAINEVKKREMLAATAGVGISVAFGAPLGGVLISLEELSYYFPHDTMFRALFCSTVSASILQLLNPFHNGKLIIYQVHYFHTWTSVEWIPFVIIGMIGGLIGFLFITTNIKWWKFRRSSKMKLFPITEVVVLSIITSVVSFGTPYLRINSSDFLAGMFSQCHGGEDATPLCDIAQTWSTVASLIISGTARLALTIFTFGSRVPSGLFIPGFCIGATYGRVVGIITSFIYAKYPELPIFSACKSVSDCIDPSIYAIIGAACVLTGMTRGTVSIVVIVLEATGDLNYLLPVTVAVMVSKFVADAFGKESIYDEIILMNEYPFMDNRTIYNFKRSAGDIMSRDLSVIPLEGNTFGSLMEFLSSHHQSGWPVVTNMRDMGLVGFITKTELRQALEFAGAHRVVQDNTNCYFSKQIPEWERRPFIDLVPWMDSTPIQVVPGTPLNNVHDMFTRMGMRYILVANHGNLVGIITKKDMLQYIQVHYHHQGKHAFETDI